MAIDWLATLPSPQKKISLVIGNANKERKLQSGRTEIRNYGHFFDKIKVLFRFTWEEWALFQDFYERELNFGLNWITAEWLSFFGYNVLIAPFYKVRIIGYPRQILNQNYWTDVTIEFIIQENDKIVNADKIWQCAHS